MMGVIIKSEGTSYVHTKSEGLHKETEGGEKRHEIGLGQKRGFFRIFSGGSTVWKSDGEEGD